MAMLSFCQPASCQGSRWLLSFNPLGLLEPKGALGVGAGLKLNKYVELWSETSLLRTVIYAGDSSLTGVRQIVQIKCFPHGCPDFFVAAEVRYKTYQYRVGDEFFNPTTSLYLENYMYTVQRRFFGEALQLGFRRSLKEDLGLYIEFTAGLGIKQPVFRRNYTVYRVCSGIDTADLGVWRPTITVIPLYAESYNLWFCSFCDALLLGAGYGAIQA